MSTARTRFIDIAPWETLRRAYGPAGDVPPVLEQMAASTGRELHELLSELCSRVLHQGTIYSARIVLVSCPRRRGRTCEGSTWPVKGQIRGMSHDQTKCLDHRSRHNQGPPQYEVAQGYH